MACVVNPDGTISCPELSFLQKAALAEYVAQAQASLANSGTARGRDDATAQAEKVRKEVAASPSPLLVLLVDPNEIRLVDPNAIR